MGGDGIQTSGTGSKAVLTKAPVPPACWNLDVLEDVSKGWDGECLGLAKNADAKTMATCEETCKGNPNCAAWQYSGIGEAANPAGHCYQGVPTGTCETRAGFKADGGQRLKHGDTKVLKSAIGVEVMNLKEFKMVRDQTVAISEERCQKECYSTWSCGVWQYGENDCWIEAAPNNVAAQKALTGNAFAKDVKAGEFIEHFCPPKPPKEEPTNWLLIGLLIGAGVLILGAILAVLLKKKPKVKKTRAIKIAPPAEPAQVPLMWIPQPTVMYQQPSVVLQQQPVYQQVVQPQQSVIMR